MATTAASRRALGRLCRFGFARWTDHGAALGVHAQVPPLSERHLARLPEWTQRAHDRLLGEHLDQLANPQQREPQEEQRRVGVAAIAGRRDALGGIQQRPPRRSPRGLALEP
ncbi:MAG: hypothetical protein U5R31_16575 [Acidimicrobiia bacterium]|nr:hypothetical protein [Acidimicrobiia bacterium]